MNINFEDLSEQDNVSWTSMDQETIKAFYVDFYTEDNEFVLTLYIEDKLAKCVSSSVLPTYGWVKLVEVMARVARFIRTNSLYDHHTVFDTMNKVVI